MHMRQLVAVGFAFAAYFQVSFDSAESSSIDTLSSTAKVVRECSMRGVCGHRGAMHQMCPYHGPPLRISAEKDRQTLASLCPHLFQGIMGRIRSECFREKSWLQDQRQ
ncbi:Stomatin-3 [Dirofilaria immitis]